MQPVVCTQRRSTDMGSVESDKRCEQDRLKKRQDRVDATDGGVFVVDWEIIDKTGTSEETPDGSSPSGDELTPVV